jgi:ligand-binding sensor domain-containing protein/serine phosphatase RsbU (regulator of sigma subunit)
LTKLRYRTHLRKLKIKPIYIIAILIFSGCTKNQEVRTTSEYSPAKSVQLNTQEGYLVNSVTGDSIPPFLDQNGITIQTGSFFITKGTIISPDSLKPPTTINFSAPKVLESKLNTTGITAPQIELGSLIYPVLSSDAAFFINAIGDTVKTGVPIQVKSVIVNATTPEATTVLPARFKDNMINDMSYLDTDHGLPNNYVWSLLIDSSQHVWFGNWNGGLSKYDGNSLLTYTKREGLPVNSIKVIIEDRHGNKWIGTDQGGLCKFDGSHFTHFTLENNVITDLLEDRFGNIWYATSNGASKYDPISNDVIHFTINEGLPSNNVTSLEEDNNGNIWISTRGGGICKFNIEQKKIMLFEFLESTPSDNIKASMCDRDGNLWFGSQNGLFKVNPTTNEFLSFENKLGPGGININCLKEGNDGDIWIGSANGILRVNSEINAYTHFTQEDGLCANSVAMIDKDQAGSIWVSTYGGGVSIFSEQSFHHLTTKQGLSGNSVRGVLEDHAGDLWFGTQKGAVKYNIESQFFYHFFPETDFSSNTVHSIAEDHNHNIWFGFSSAGAICYKPMSNTYFNYKLGSGMLSNHVTFITEDSKENLWFGTSGGAVKYNIETEIFTQFTTENGLIDNDVQVIIEDSKGKIWFGTSAGGISVFDGEKIINYTQKEGMSSDAVISLMEDTAGRIWIGTIGAGLSVFDPEDNSFVHLTEDDGITNNIIYSLIQDDDDVWLSTEKGITLIKGAFDDTYSLNQKIIGFERLDGLKGLDFYYTSAIMDRNKNIWWGGSINLSYLNTNNFSLATKAPKLSLNQIEINGQFIDFLQKEQLTKQGILFDSLIPFSNCPLELILPHNHNHLTFQFSGIDWTASHKIQYSYKIEDLSEHWSTPAKEPKADYRNLPYGTHTFLVKAKGETGIWTAPIRYVFKILPPWWHTWWARTGYGILTLIIIIGIVRWRTTKLKERQKELESEVQDATREIREQKEQVEEAHKEIKDSMKYAKRIQSAILPPHRMVKEYLEDSFILYKPKDIVAGDFYWMECKDGKVWFAAADCTGHGVPGALVSVICNGALNRSVREFNLTDPAEILGKSREIVVAEFDKSDEKVNDGMDIALCVLEGYNLKYAGANNPLWIIRNGQLIETKADKQPIGKFDNPMPYTTHNFDLQKGDSIYIFSDGYIDQFGGEKGKKFKRTNFKTVLLSIQDKSMEEQKNILNESFEDWRGPLEQIDDVCVIGVRIK